MFSNCGSGTNIKDICPAHKAISFMGVAIYDTINRYAPCSCVTTYITNPPLGLKI